MIIGGPCPLGKSNSGKIAVAERTGAVILVEGVIQSLVSRDGVDIGVSDQVKSPVADVSHLQFGVWQKLTLNGEVPLPGIRQDVTGIDAERRSTCTARKSGGVVQRAIETRYRQRERRVARH